MPTAFLSHSSRDKDFVRPVFQALGAARANYDEATFEQGESSADEIYKGIANADLFVLFVSPDSISSKWVQSEIAIAKSRVFSGRIKKVLVFLLEGADAKLLPDWLRDYVYGHAKNPKVVAQLIRSNLLDIALNVGSDVQLFVGRDQELADFKHELAKVEGRSPDILFLSGTEGIGRRTLLRRTLQDTYPWLSKFVVEIFLGRLQGEIEFFRELLTYGKLTKIEDLLNRVHEFESADGQTRTAMIAEVVRGIVEQKQTILLRAHDSVVQDNGDLQEWLARLVRELKPHTHPQLTIISRRNLAPKYRDAYGGMHCVFVPSLSRTSTLSLLSLWLKQFGIAPPAALLNDVVESVEGHPKQTEVAARYIAEVGVARIETDRVEFLEMIQQRAHALLDRLELTGEQIKIIAVFREFEFLSADDIVSTIDLSDEMVGACLGFLQDHGVIEKNGRYLQIAPYLSNAVSRYRQKAETSDFVDAVQNAFVRRVETLTTDDLAEISTIDNAVLALLRSGRVFANPLLTRVLLPSQQLRVAREFYDDRQYAKAAELARKALSRDHLLSPDAQLEGLRIRALSLAREHDTEGFHAALATIQGRGDRPSQRTAHFVRGFKLRWDGRVDQAEQDFRAAYSLGGERNFHILRELAQVLVARGELREAESHARTALSIAPRNPYVIDNLLEILIERERANPNLLAENKEIQKLLPVLQETARAESRSFYESRQAHFFSALGNPIEALRYAEEAVKVTPHLVPVRLMQVRVLLAARRPKDALDKIHAIRKSIAPGGGDRRFVVDIDRLHVKAELADGNFAGARKQIDFAVNAPDKLRQSLREEVAYTIVHSANAPPSEVEWANRFLAKK